MKKLISVLTVMLILLASVWAMLPAVAASLPFAPAFGAEDVGGNYCLNHTFGIFGGWGPTIPATCTTGSYRTRTCKVCGFVDIEMLNNSVTGGDVTDGDVTGHVPAAGYEFDEATETHSFDCTRCNEKITEACTMELKGTQPECETAVTNTYECSVCSGTVTRTETPAQPAHNVDKWETVNGTLQHSGDCTGCKQTVYENCTFEEIYAMGDCENGGTRTFKCNKCGRLRDENFPAGHNIEVWLHIEGTTLHAGQCTITTCKKTLNLECEIDTFITNPVTAENPNPTHTGTCSICNAEYTKACEFDKDYTPAAGTASHQKNCKDCGRNVTEMCVADNNGWTSGKDGTHSATCVLCKSKFSALCTPSACTHVKDTETHATTCTVCDEEYTEACEVKTWIPSGSVNTAMIEILADDGDAATTVTDGNVTPGDATVDPGNNGTTDDPGNNDTAGDSGNNDTTGDSGNNDTTGDSGNNDTAGDSGNSETETETEQKYTHKGVCEKCRFEYEKECFVETWTLDIAKGVCTGNCKDCGRVITHKSEIGKWKYDAAKNEHHTECSVCNATARHAVEVSSQWKHVEAPGENCHEAKCAICSTDVLAACDFAADANDAHTQICKVCKFSLTSECSSFEKDKENSTEATCTEKGYTYYNCLVCGKRNDAKTREYDALGHNLVIDEENKITSTEDSHTATYVCKNEGCDYSETKTEKHTFGKAKADKDGKHIVECTVCGKTKSEACKAEKIPAVAATCTKGGLTEGSKCSVCGAVLKEQTATSAKGHDYKYFSTTATCSKAGKDIFKCICGEKKEVDAAANGKHDWKENNRVAATASANGYVEYKCKNCTETYREVLTYSVKTGVSNALSPVAAVILLSGAAFVGVRKLRKEED